MLPNTNSKLIIYGAIYHITLALFAISNVNRVCNAWTITICLSAGTTVLVYLTKYACNNSSTKLKKLTLLAAIGFIGLFAVLLNTQSMYHVEWRLLLMAATFYAMGLATIQLSTEESSVSIRAALFTIGSIIGLLISFVLTQVTDVTQFPDWWPILPLILIGVSQFGSNSTQAKRDMPKRRQHTIVSKEFVHAGLASAAMILIGTWLATNNQASTWTMTLIAYLTGTTISRIWSRSWNVLLTNGLPVILLIVTFLVTSNVKHYISSWHVIIASIVALFLSTCALHSPIDSSATVVNPTFSRVLGTLFGTGMSFVLLQAGCPSLIGFMVLLPIIAYCCLGKLLRRSYDKRAINILDLVIVGVFAIYLIATYTMTPTDSQWLPIVARWQMLLESQFGISVGWMPTGSQIDCIVRSILPCMFCFLTVDRASRFALCLAVLILVSITIN